MSAPKNPQILIISDYYLPGQKSGGGLRTLVNIVDRLFEDFDFRVITRDHDHTVEKEQYTDVSIDEWNELGRARVFYLSKNNIKLSKLRELILEVRPAVLFFNSYFSPLTIYVLLLKKLRLIPDINVVVAPCGELSANALKIKAAKKQAFLTFAKISGLYRNVIWKASTDLEKQEIENVKSKGGKIYVVPDLSPKAIFEEFRAELKPQKKKGAAKMIFLSRFARKKNFRWLLENLRGIDGTLEIDVFGPIEEKDYWEDCLRIIEKLPPNIKIRARGAVTFEQVAETLVQYHFFILPSLTENFGYVFLEAAACGCPLIISDQTPWRDLEEKGIGWDLSLETPEKWISVINQCLEMDAETFTKLSKNAARFAENWLADSKIEDETRRLFAESSKEIF